MNDPTVDCRIIDADATLGHHFPKIAQAQPIGKVPANAKQNDGSIEMAPLEHLKPPKISEGHCQTTRNQRVCNRTSQRPRSQSLPPESERMMLKPAGLTPNCAEMPKRQQHKAC